MRCRKLVVGVVGLLGCGGTGGARGGESTSIILDPTGTVGHGETTSSTSSAGSADGATTLASSTTGEGITTGDPPKYDISVPPGADVGTPGVVGIPKTCAEAAMTQSTVGCSFHGAKLQNFTEAQSAMIVGNVSETNVANAQLYFDGGAGEVAVGPSVAIDPLAAHVFVMDSPVQPGDVSVLRDGGVYRVETDVPIVAYQHSPIAAQATNDSSLLIPDHALGRFYVVASWETNITGNTSAFNVIALDDGTDVTWTPPNPSSAGAGVPAVAAGASGSVTVDANDLLQVLVPIDASGTIVETDKPAWVVGTSPCADIPTGVTFCDHIEELLIPLEYWGTEYYCPRAPLRGAEHYWWRIYSGSDNNTITTDPPQPNTPIDLDRGEYVEFSTLESFTVTSDAAVMPVQYLEGTDGGGGTGDPASYQMVPSAQFLDRYVFVTGTLYTENYVQVIRPLGGAEITVDGTTVEGYEAVGDYEFADWPITEGAHYADSDEPFGVIQVGYTGVTSYAYPGGLALGFINPNPEG